MGIKHIILEAESIIQMQELLDSKAQSGYTSVSLNSYFDSNFGKTYYTALIVKQDESADDRNPE